MNDKIVHITFASVTTLLPHILEDKYFLRIYDVLCQMLTTDSSRQYRGPERLKRHDNTKKSAKITRIHNRKEETDKKNLTTMAHKCLKFYFIFFNNPYFFRYKIFQT